MLFKITSAVLLAVHAASAAAQEDVTTSKRRTQEVTSSPRKCTEAALECDLNGPEWSILNSIPMADTIFQGLQTYCDSGMRVGSNTALLPEAADAAISGATIEDGMSGDTNFPFMDMKTLLSAGERSVCPESYGYKLTGVPDGMGAYLLDDDTVRVVYQSESYGPLRFESFPAAMNDGSFTMGGSRVQYVDYDRAMMADYMMGSYAASEMVVGVGTMVRVILCHMDANMLALSHTLFSTMSTGQIERAVNLKGELIGPRNPDGPTTEGAHYGNADGTFTFAPNSIFLL